jgi:hypothetical protein
MVNTHNGRGDVEAPWTNGLNPPPSLTLAQAIASILESRDEQTELLRQLVANSTHYKNGARNAPTPSPTTYGEFAVTHPPIFTEARDPLEADHWLQTMESMFELLHCTDLQKTLHHAAAAWRRHHMVGQLHRCSPRGLLGAMGRVLQRLRRPSHSSRHDEEKVPRVHGPKARWKTCARLSK